MVERKIGIIGGFGAFATLDFIKRLLLAFPNGSERNYPHIIVDNNFTMPSRTRALLYGDDYDVIVEAIAESIQMMLSNDVDYIVLVCGTAHYFLKDVYKILPDAQKKIVNIIECLAAELKKNEENEVLVIAAEGALKQHLYSGVLEKYGISTIEPGESEFDEIRYYIEAVKRDNFDKKEDMREMFLDFLSRYKCHSIVLGCTEFPVLTGQLWEGKEIRDYKFYDPCQSAINYLFESIEGRQKG